MKFKIEMDAEVTPKELREFLGLPDVEGLQQEMIEQVRENMTAGVDGFDPVLLMRPWLPESMKSMDIVQKGLWETLRQAGNAMNNVNNTEESKPAPRRTARNTRRKKTASDD